MKTFSLEVLTQEKHLLSETIHSLTAPTETGEITVLADHIPLFSRLIPGELTYRKSGSSTHFAVSGGFIDISPRNLVTVLADSAVRSDEINLPKVEQAIQNAQKALEQAPDKSTSLQIEIELRHAIMQANIARKRHHSSS